MALMLAVSFGLAVAVSLTALRFNLLSPDGAVAAAIIGGIVLRCGLIPWAALLATFFVSSSALSLLNARVTQDVAEKGHRRDAAQVLANGGVPAACALLYLLHAETTLLLGYTAGVAAATADTWATEVGTRFGGAPWSLKTLAPVQRGTSGAITTVGIGAACAGAVMIGSVGVLWGLPTSGIWIVPLAGVLGATADSLLGAWLQETRECPNCGIRTEQRVHRQCHTPTVRAGGVPTFSNDAVNLCCTLVAVVVTFTLVAAT